MNKQNLALLAEGHKLIALAYAREAGIEAEATETKVAVEEVAPVAKTKAPKEDAPEVNDTAVETDSDEVESEGYTEAELKAMKVADLKEILDDADIEYGSKPTKADLVALILEAQDADEDAEVELEEADAEEETEVDAEEDAEGEEDLTAEDLDEMSLAELKDLADEYEITYAKSVKAPKLREILIEELFTDEEPEEVEPEAEEGDELAPEDLDEMSLSELKALADEYEVTYSKVIKAPKLREILIAELFAEEADESEATDLDETDYAEELGLNEMDIDELAEILTEHELPAKGKKQALIARIVEAIEDGTIEIDGEDEGE